MYSNTLSTGTYYQLLGAFPLKNLLKTDIETKNRQKIPLWHHHYFYNQSTNLEFRAKNSYFCNNQDEKENISNYSGNCWTRQSRVQQHQWDASYIIFSSIAIKNARIFTPLSNWRLPIIILKKCRLLKTSLTTMSVATGY